MKDKNKSKLNKISIKESGCSSSESKKPSKETLLSKSFDKPTPLDFDGFIPWLCLEWQLPYLVIVARQIQEEYVNQERKLAAFARSKGIKTVKLKPEDTASTPDPNLNSKKSTATTSNATTASTSNIPKNVVLIKAHYESKGRLVEISITGCKIQISKKLIHAINICMPFHSLLTKLTIRKSKLTNSLLQEISKLLPHSSLTDICLDECVVPEGQYHLLLEKPSQLKCLSLNRCQIDDTTCKALAKIIDFESPGCTLLVLELGSNVISDIGAKALGETLRKNRCLLHLNLSGNKITDTGASTILAHLMSYKLTWNEIFDMKQRRLRYMVKKEEVYASCLKEVLERKTSDVRINNGAPENQPKVKSWKTRKEEENRGKQKKEPRMVSDVKTTAEEAEEMTKAILEKFSDPFDENGIVTINGKPHSKGNMVLCSLNFAHNDLNFMSVKKIFDVLEYQDRVVKSGNATGLLRIVIDGNYIPANCVEYARIGMYLNKAVLVNSSSRRGT